MGIKYKMGLTPIFPNIKKPPEVSQGRFCFAPVADVSGYGSRIQSVRLSRKPDYREANRAYAGLTAMLIFLPTATNARIISAYSFDGIFHENRYTL